MSGALPPGWTVTTLGTVGRWGSGGTPKTSDRSYYGGAIPWVKSGDLNDGPLFKTEDKITEAGLANSAAKLLEPGALLIALYGATIGRVAVNQIACATNQAVAHCAPHARVTTVDYLFWFTLASRAELRELGHGGAQPNISQAILKAFPIPLPPLPEQRRIVARIEALFARIRRARADLERITPLVKRESARALPLLDRLEQSILTRAFRGELVVQDPKDEPAAALISRLSRTAPTLRPRRGRAA
jgi:type I restriction enzyme S subunit